VISTRDEIRYRVNDLMSKLCPDDLTNDELLGLAEILGYAWDRKQEPIVPGVVYLDFGSKRTERSSPAVV
jgi:hypothetical protein